MTYLTADQFVAKDERRYEDVKVPGGLLRMRSLYEGERADLEDRLASEKRKDRLKVKRHIVQAGICDEHGNTLFTDEHVKKMAKKESATIDHLAAACMNHIGISEADFEAMLGEPEADSKKTVK